MNASRAQLVREIIRPAPQARSLFVIGLRFYHRAPGLRTGLICALFGPPLTSAVGEAP